MRLSSAQSEIQARREWSQGRSGCSQEVWTQLQLLTNARKSALVAIPLLVFMLEGQGEGRLDAFAGFCWIRARERWTHLHLLANARESALAAIPLPVSTLVWRSGGSPLVVFCLLGAVEDCWTLFRLSSSQSESQQTGRRLDPLADANHCAQERLGPGGLGGCKELGRTCSR